MEKASPVALHSMRRMRRPSFSETRESLRRYPPAKASGNSSGISAKRRARASRKAAGAATAFS